MRTTLFLWALAILTWGCENDLGTVRDPVGDNPPLADWSDAAAPPARPGDDDPPTITIDTAEDDGEGMIALAGTTADDRSVTAVRIDVGASGPYDVVPIGRGFNTWQATVPAPAAGPVALRATAFDAQGNTGIAERLLDRPLPADDTPPVVRIRAPENGSNTNVARLFVTGTAEDDSAIAEVTVALLVGDAEMPLGRALTGDFFANWSLAVPVPPATTFEYVVTATDIAGNSTQEKVEVVSRAAPPHDPPRLVSSTPADGAEIDQLRADFTLTVEGDAAVEQVTAGPVGGPLFEAAPVADAANTYAVTLWLVPGDNTIRVISRDADGLVGRDLLRVVQDDGFGPLVPIDLLAPTEPGGEIQLELDKAGVVEMFPEDVQAETLLMELDARPLVRNALGVIRDACGPGWEGPHFVNGSFLFDCPEEWGQAELNLWGLLTMTPSNVDVSGTSLGFLPDLIPGNLGPDVSFGAVLGEALRLGPFDPMLDVGPLTDAIVDALIAPHPRSTAAGAMPVTLLDGLEDMAPLAEKFGPDGAHPGFINSRVYAAVLTDDFTMSLRMESNLVLYEGVDLEAQTKRYFADRDPAQPVVGLAFLELADFDLTGIAPRPEVEMDFRMVESDLAATPGRRMGADDGSLPDGQGNSDVWDAPFETWMLEYVVALASQYGFGTLSSGCDRCAGLEPAGRDEGAMLWLAGFNSPPCELGQDGEFDAACRRFDFAEITVGTAGYDCGPGLPCTNFLRGPNQPGLTEHMGRLVQDDCDGDLQVCRDLFGPDYECQRHGICLDATDPDVCFRDVDCGPGNYCVAGACSDAPPSCEDDADCADAELCYHARCVDVPEGWFRAWLPDVGEVSPAYMWDVVLEVAQARMRDGVAEGEGDVVFELEGVWVGLDDEQIEALVRDALEAQADWLSNALLGSYADNNPELDLFIDRFDGESWLMVSPCRVGAADLAGCNAPGAGLFDADGGQLDQQAPSGIGTGVPLSQLTPGQGIYYQGQPGTPQRRLDIRDVHVGGPERDGLSLWLRQ